MSWYSVVNNNIGEFVLPKPDPPEQIMKNTFYYKILFEYRIGKRTNLTKFSWFLTGMGLDLNNEHPTMCVNQMISDRNRLNPGKPELGRISREQYLARTFNNLEYFIGRVETAEGLKEVLDLYHRYW